MTPEEFESRLMSAIDAYIERIHADLDNRWTRWNIDVAEAEKYEVLGGLLARQITLASEIAMNPPIWNAHIAPLVLRSMIDVYISMAWISIDPLERSRTFILYGLGQDKLTIEHHKARISARGENPDEDLIIQEMEAVVNSQRYTFLTEVNIGNWSGHNTRKMAEEADCLDLYRFAYTPFSAATHSTWSHLYRYNLDVCRNPLHGLHRVPVCPMLGSDPDYVYRVAKYVNMSLTLFDKTADLAWDTPSAFDELVEAFDDLSEAVHASGGVGGSEGEAQRVEGLSDES